MGKIKHNPKPWGFLDNFRGKDFSGDWPSLPQLFDITTKRYPENKCFEAFTPKHILFNYTEANKTIKQIANYLYTQGIRKGDFVGLTGKNSPEWAMAYLATLYAGAVIVPIDYSLTDSEIQALLDFAGVKGLFVDGERLERIGGSARYGFNVSLEEAKHEDDYILTKCVEEDQAIVSASPKDIAAVLFTSGTTGNPKGVTLSHENLVANCFMAQGWMNIFSTDVFYAILPIHHAYTMLAVFIESISVGANLIFGKKLIISQIFKEMREGKVTMLLAVPMLYNKMIAALLKGVKEKGPIVNFLIRALMEISGVIKKVFHANPGKKMFGFLLKKLSLEYNRICISGGGPLPPSTFKHFNQLGIDFVQGYGLTETSPILTLNPTFDYEETSIGKPLPFVEMKFVDPDEQGNGEICVKGPNLMQGYLKNPEATSEIIDSDGWLHTGDIGQQDSKGFVYLTGRAKNIIVTEGGKNVFPEEVEDHFQLYDEIEQICVFGFTQDATMKIESVCALIVPTKKFIEDTGNMEKVKQHMEEVVETVNKELLPYKRIRKVIVIEEPMEMTSTKKIKRFAVSKKYKELINA